MESNAFQRQNFLGEDSEKIFASCSIAVIGLCGGGSHVVQQTAHIGFGNYITADPDIVEDTNLNRMVGATAEDAIKGTLKVDVARRVILGINPNADIVPIAARWQTRPEVLRECDVIFGCVDQYAERDQLEKLARRFLIPYIDIGMDVHPFGSGYLISGQVALSMPGKPCLWCMGLLTDELLQQEAAKYGQAGSRPQVVWPNGILASTALGLFIQLVTPWHDYRSLPMLVEYDGNSHTMLPSKKLYILNQKTCTHYKATDVGDPFLRI